jgi:hypothetical protein
MRQPPGKQPWRRQWQTPRVSGERWAPQAALFAATVCDCLRVFKVHL